MAKKRLKEGLTTKAEEIVYKIKRDIKQLEEVSPLDPYLQAYNKWLPELIDSFI